MRTSSASPVPPAVPRGPLSARCRPGEASREGQSEGRRRQRRRTGTQDGHSHDVRGRASRHRGGGAAHLARLARAAHLRPDLSCKEAQRLLLLLLLGVDADPARLCSNTTRTSSVSLVSALAQRHEGARGRGGDGRRTPRGSKKDRRYQRLALRSSATDLRPHAVCFANTQSLLLARGARACGKWAAEEPSRATPARAAAAEACAAVPITVPITVGRGEGASG